MDDIANLYRYEDLPAEHIRVIKLQPGSQGDPIVCEVAVEHRKDAENTYDAISYVWGDPDDIEAITCNGSVLLIPGNLFEALGAIRNPASPSRLWADSICINQDDESEKGHQVKKMGHIYENARAVFVWLGSDVEEIAKDCFDLIRDTNTYLCKQLERHQSISKVPSFRKPYPVCSDPAAWSKVRSLVRLPWFSRIWVIQEVGLAKKGIVMWGREQLNFDELVEIGLWEVFRNDFSNITGRAGLETVVTPFYDIQATYRNKDTWRSNLPLTRQITEEQLEKSLLFLQVLDGSRGGCASDPRDRIYAFLGHPHALKENGETIVEPQYGEPVDAVYLDLACTLLNHPREAPFVLSYVHFPSTKELEERIMPSWVPDWDTGWYQYSTASPRFWYKAGQSNGETQYQFQSEVCDQGDIMSLNIQGIIFGRLVWTSEPVSWNNLSMHRNLWDEETQYSNEHLVDTLLRDGFKAAPCTPERSRDREDSFSMALVQGYPGTKKREDMFKHRRDYQAYLRASRRAMQLESNSFEDLDTGSDQGGAAVAIESQLTGLTARKFACTQDGQFATVPGAAEANDICCVVIGLSVPFILRPAGNGRYYVVGDSYVHGVMEGELVDKMEMGGVKQETITLI